MTTFLVLLRFAAQRDKAKALIAGHNAWIQRGFDDGALLLTGSLQPGIGGVVLARTATRAELDERIADDPFVAEGVVIAEVLEVAPSRLDPRLAFLVEWPG